jgi:hypothetical protein
MNLYSLVLFSHIVATLAARGKSRQEALFVENILP